MIGWTLVFAVMSTTALVAGATRGIGFTTATFAALVFVLLLLISALARALRGRA